MEPPTVWRTENGYRSRRATRTIWLPVSMSPGSEFILPSRLTAVFQALASSATANRAAEPYSCYIAACEFQHRAAWQQTPQFLASVDMHRRVLHVYRRRWEAGIVPKMIRRKDRRSSGNSSSINLSNPSILKSMFRLIRKGIPTIPKVTSLYHLLNSIYAIPHKKTKPLPGLKPAVYFPVMTRMSAEPSILFPFK